MGRCGGRGILAKRVMDDAFPQVFPVISLNAACAALDNLVVDRPGKTVLHQYWDRDPPKQITTLLRHNAKLCRKMSIGHEVWDAPRAEAFLQSHWPQHLDLFRAAPHPAMASDLFRLCVIATHGGLYLDADMGLNPASAAQLPGLLHEGLVFKWTAQERRNVPNWCFGFRAGHPMLLHVLDHTATSMCAALEADPTAALQDILTVSGPGRFTIAIAQWITRHGCPPGFLVIPVEKTGSMVVNGPEILKKPLAYKETATHWLVAANQARGD